MTLLARYFFTSDRESLVADGADDFSTEDFAQLSPVALLASRDSLPKIKDEIETATREYLNDTFDAGGVPLVFSWAESAPGHWQMTDTTSGEHFASLVLQEITPI